MPWARHNDRVHAPDKAQLRERLTAARRARTPEDIDRARAAVCAAVLARCDGAGWRCVAAYLPLRTEPGSLELLAGLHTRGVRVLVPIVRPDRDLDWATWPDGPDDRLGPDAIADADLVLVPALAVTPVGIRLGRGGGSYDRALPRARPDVPRAALLYDGEVVDELPREIWDVPVTAVVTPDGWRELAAG
jgi:5-formyltetrahydrofolate cyclo-ligase